MFKKILTTGAVAAASLLMVVGGSSAAMAAGPNLVKNGHFQHNSIWEQNNGEFYPGDKAGAWDISGSNPGAPALQTWFPGMAGDGATVGAPFTYNGWAAVNGSISQTIPTEADKTYVLNYQSRATGMVPTGSGWGGGNTSYADVDGARVDTFTAVTDPLYTLRTVTFTATSDSTFIEFGNVGNGAAGFDEISITVVDENDSPLMVPAIAGGIGMAALAAGSGLVISRKNKRAGK